LKAEIRLVLLTACSDVLLDFFILYLLGGSIMRVKQLKLDLSGGCSNLHFFDIMAEYFDDKISFDKFLILIEKGIVTEC
tara:strand:- start:662 stop:898 length:237 start_codon:yes stop_codon:yes gene_type:complete